MVDRAVVDRAAAGRAAAVSRAAEAAVETSAAGAIVVATAAAARSKAANIRVDSTMADSMAVARIMVEANTTASTVRVGEPARRAWSSATPAKRKRSSSPRRPSIPINGFSLKKARGSSRRAVDMLCPIGKDACLIVALPRPDTPKPSRMGHGGRPAISSISC